VAPFAAERAQGHALVPGLRDFRTGQRDFAAFRRWIMRSATEPAVRRKGPRDAN
jgi:LysR family glycine cleavage system transcriptional activator